MNISCNCDEESLNRGGTPPEQEGGGWSPTPKKIRGKFYEK